MDREVRGVHRFAAAEAGFHFGIEDPSDEQSSFDRVGGLALAKMGLDGVGERFEKIAVVPWTNVEARGPRLFFAGEFAREMPVDSAAGRRGQHDGAWTRATPVSLPCLASTMD